jgi:PAS domain S-box-containing protein
LHTKSASKKSGRRSVRHTIGKQKRARGPELHLDGMRGAEKERTPVGDHERLFTLSLDLLCIAGFDGYLKYMNPAWVKTFGFSEKELLKKPFIKYIHPEDRARTIAEMQKLSAGKPTLYFENRFQCKDGQFKQIAWTSSPVPSEGMTYSVGRDITERKRSEEALQESEKKYRLLVDNMPDVVFTIDLEGNFAFCAPQAEKMTGYSVRQLLSMNMKELVAPEQMPAIQERLQVRIKGERSLLLCLIFGT